jgi:hypothetical protein
MDILCDDDLGHLHPLLFKKGYLEFEGISIGSSRLSLALIYTIR